MPRTAESTLDQCLVDWPMPPYVSLFRESETNVAETCVLNFLDGKKALGTLLRFSADESTLSIQLDRAKEIEAIDFDRLKSVRLSRPLKVQRQDIALEARAQQIFPPSERQNYTVTFSDHQIQEGETVGHIPHRNGLFLFFPVEHEKIVRCFIPRQAIDSYRIGRPIGALLVDEKAASGDEIQAALERQHQLRAQRIGDYLAEHEIVSREQLVSAINHQESQPLLRLGEALLQLDLLTNGQLEDALTKQRQNRQLPLGQILIDMGIVDERTLKGALAKQLGIPYVGLSKFNFDPEAIRLVNASFARRQLLMPLCFQDNALVIAFENPLNTTASEELRFLTQKKILPAMASREDILSAIAQYYDDYGASERVNNLSHKPDGQYEYDVRPGGGESHSNEFASKMFEQDTAADVIDEPVAESDNVLVQMVNKMILDAHHSGASDIHVETYPGKQNTRIRFRKDGTLIDYLEIPSAFRNAVISRIKIMAQLDISERRKPQDGKIDFQQFGPANIELRIATIPTANGLEDVVMRVLASAKPVSLDRLGLAPAVLATLKKLMQRPYGLVLVCGPTGSGKTTTLHSMLGFINTPGRKIWTAEDPIEITQAGLRQVQINAKIGWTFASAMRSFLRADPDVIMVGEMRDGETAKVGIEASLTGHLVLSTLHTNSAPESVIRLLDLGMDPFNFADALILVLAQRLAKALCSRCKEPYQAEPMELTSLATEYCDGNGLDAVATLDQWRLEYARHDAFTLYRAKGCEHCNSTGYQGRLGLHELLSVTAPIKRLIQDRAPVSELLPAAIAGGMRTLKQDGLVKVLQGFTDVFQVRAVSV